MRGKYGRQRLGRQVVDNIVVGGRKRRRESDDVLEEERTDPIVKGLCARILEDCDVRRAVHSQLMKARAVMNEGPT